MNARHLIFGIVLIQVVGILVIAWKWMSMDPPRTEAPIEGVVFSPTGDRVSGATVYVVFNGWEDPRHVVPDPPRGATNSRGEFRIDGLQFRGYFLVATHPDYCDSESVGVVVGPRGVRGVQIRLTEGGRVAGTVDPSLGHVSGRQIRLYSHRGDIGWRSAVTDDEGGFTLDKVIAQDYIVELKPANDSIKAGLRKEITVQAGQTTRVVLGKE